jgi:serine protease
MQHLSENVIQRMTKTLNICCVILLPALSACGGSGGSSSSKPLEPGISGKVSVERGSDVDLDVNGTNALNNAQTDPQLVSNPSTIGGYLSGYAGMYASGSAFTVDQDDYFSATLVSGQIINLSLFKAEPQLDSVNMTVRLLDETGQILYSRQLSGSGSTSITVPDDGQQLIHLSVSDSTDPLLYSLELSQTLSLADASTVSAAAPDPSSATAVTKKHDSVFRHALLQHPYLQHDFVPGEVLLRYKPETSDKQHQKQVQDQKTLQAASAPWQSGMTILETLAGDIYRLGVDQQAMQRMFSFSTRTYEPQLTELETRLQTLAMIESLKASDEIEFVEPNYVYRATARTNDPRSADQWNLAMIKAAAAWQVTAGQNAVVAVLDTGIAASHEDLQANILSSGYDFISSSASSGDGDGFDVDPNDEGSSFHGSHVAGIIIAEANNEVGIAGAAYQASLMPLRVLGVQDTGSSSDIAQAIRYAAGLTNSSGQLPAVRADIINMSFGGEARSETVKAALDSAYEAGAILIAAAGNEASDTPFYPAAFDKVIGVGALTHTKTRSGFSNFGVNVSLVAPGGTSPGSNNYDGFDDAILSTLNANNYRELAGTSMAAPHVSAVAALMKSLKPDLTGAQFMTALTAGELTQTFESTLPDTSNFYGAGLIDAAKAVNWAAGAQVIPPFLSIYPNRFAFSGSNSRAELELSNPGSGSVQIKAVSFSENWISLSPKQVDSASGLGIYEVQVGFTPAPIAQGEIILRYRFENEAELTERIKVNIARNNVTDSSVGVVFISLFREEDILQDIYQPLVTVGGRLNGGAYDYCFRNVPAGRYLLAASTDHDGDKQAFDSGEASGTYPLISRPAFIELGDQPLTNINFDIQQPVLLDSGDSQIMPTTLDSFTTLNKVTKLNTEYELAQKLSVAVRSPAVQAPVSYSLPSELAAQSICQN